jgi:hypothetical protein
MCPQFYQMVDLVAAQVQRHLVLAEVPDILDKDFRADQVLFRAQAEAEEAAPPKPVQLAHHVAAKVGTVHPH